MKVARNFIKCKVDLLFTAGIGEILFHMLKDSLIDIVKADEGLSAKKISKRYFQNQLHPLTDPTHSIEASLVSQ